MIQAYLPVVAIVLATTSTAGAQSRPETETDAFARDLLFRNTVAQQVARLCPQIERNEDFIVAQKEVFYTRLLQEVPDSVDQVSYVKDLRDRKAIKARIRGMFKGKEAGIPPMDKSAEICPTMTAQIARATPLGKHMKIVD